METVWEALLDLQSGLSPSERRTLSRDGTNRLTHTVGRPGEGRMRIEIDGNQRKLTIQGEWWYRGEYSVEPHGQGSRVVYRVYNVAPGLGWWMAQLVQGPGHAREMKPRFERLLHKIRERGQQPQAVSPRTPE